ncbi:MAG TPA: hypothetical protein PLQ81_03530 [bacterium]|nr:hypothetical protein [bacterium]
MINFYAKQAVNTEPYYAAQYLEAAELAGLTGNLNLIKHYARTGLIVEPYFLRLNIIYKKMDGSQSDRFDISIKNIKQYINKRIIINGLDKGYIDSKSEIYYYEMMYNTKIKNIEFF